MIPVLYTFRRCPYAMRARLAISVSGVTVELREVLLRDKAPEFLETSPSASVPCLKVGDVVLDESFDIMRWALSQNDPVGWLDMPEEGLSLIEQADGPFKQALDRTKYATRYPESDPEQARGRAHGFLYGLNDQIGDKGFLYKQTPSLADMAILPFVRQFAFIDKTRFDGEDWPHLSGWLETFLATDLFRSIMPKFPVWKAGDDVTLFP